ncbi:hypothetical protein MMMIC1C10_11200 [Methanococcus maripaludis]|uniref:hypothetical protein n=1 Tax=Methanococcus maripaludis TaxID=39152 RepID=UPI0031419B67
MIIVKCTYKNGEEIISRINGTIKDAENYFLNKIFNIGSLEDNLQKCVKVEQIKN